MPTLTGRPEAWLAGTARPPIGLLLGIALIRCGDGMATHQMRVGPEHHNPIGTVHGGIFCDLADAAMGTALATLLGPTEIFTTVELSAHYFAAVKAGLLTAQARVVRRGRTTAYVECELTDEAQRTVGKFDCTCLILPMRGEGAQETDND